MRPQIVGEALKKISQDAQISQALFKVLETQNIIGGKATITLIPEKSGLLADLLASPEGVKSPPLKT